MSATLKKLWNDYGFGGLLIALLVLYILYMFYNYAMTKGMYGNETMSQERKPAYNNVQSGPMPAVEGGNEVFSSVNGPTTTGQGMPSSCNKVDNINPADLLPRDTNSEWAQLNPSGKGELENINLLKAGYHIGINTVAQTLRNANLQIRSEDPNPQINVGPWNQSTIEPDVMRPPFEIGQGTQ
jgi:hypothetical protein